MNITAGNMTAIRLDLTSAISRNSRTLNNPIVGLLLAAGILARVAQAKQSAAGAAAGAAAAAANPWLQLQGGQLPGAVPPNLASPGYNFYPPYQVAPGPYPWWYAVEPFSLYPVPPQFGGGFESHGGEAQGGHETDTEHPEEHSDKDDIHYPAEDSDHPPGHSDEHEHSHEHEHLESGEQSAPGSYESESENVDKQVASNEIPAKPNTDSGIKPVVESAEETNLEPVALQLPSSTTAPTTSASSFLPTATSGSSNSTLLTEASRTVQNIVNLLQKIEGNFSRLKTNDPIRQRPNQHQLVLQEAELPPKGSITNILLQLNTTRTSELAEGEKLAEESSKLTPVLAMSGASHTVRRQPRPEVKPQGNAKKGTTTRRPGNNRNQNRQKPQQRKPTTARVPVYEDEDYEYDYTTQRYKPSRRTTARRKPDYRRSTAPSVKDDDDYDYDNYYSRTQRPNRRRQSGGVNIYKNNRNNFNNRMKPTTPSYDDDFDDAYGDEPSPYYTNDDYAYRPAPAQAQVDYADYRDDREDVGRQGTVTEDYEDESTTTTTTGTTTTTTEQSGTPAPTGSSPTPTVLTNGTTLSTSGYPYGPGSNISFTYGPPVGPQPGYGYGPSNGNENISITYGPPTGGNNNNNNGAPPSGASGTGAGGSPQQYVAAGVPSLDWYNQYAKNNVFKRIQDLLAPNNFYSPQYDTDKYNYNDNTF